MLDLHDPYLRTHHISPSSHHFPTANQLPFQRLHFVPFHAMADHSGSSGRSTRFRALFKAALQDYEKATNVSLASHPLATQLQSCQSAESITAILQSQAPAFGESQGSDRAMISIKGIVLILTRLSATSFLGDAIDLVCHQSLMACSTALIVFTAISTCGSNTRWFRDPTCCMCRSFAPI